MRLAGVVAVPRSFSINFLPPAPARPLPCSSRRQRYGHCSGRGSGFSSLAACGLAPALPAQENPATAAWIRPLAVAVALALQAGKASGLKAGNHRAHDLLLDGRKAWQGCWPRLR